MIMPTEPFARKTTPAEALCVRWSELRSTDWFAALAHLKEKRSEITQQIKVVERESERCRRTERKESRVRILERHRKVAQMVLRDGMSIKDAGKAIGVGQVCARTLLHRWCAHANPELYKGGYHHNEYEGGWSNDCPPPLNWLRDHAEDFAANNKSSQPGQ